MPLIAVIVAAVSQDTSSSEERVESQERLTILSDRQLETSREAFKHATVDHGVATIGPH